MRRWILCLLTLFCAAIMAYSGIQLWKLFLEYKMGRDSYRELERYAVLDAEAKDASAPVSAEGDENAETQMEWNAPAVDFESLRRINPDTAAWLCGPETKINYPVVQGEDNEYYLTHLFDGRSGRSGAIFFDCRTGPDLQAKNTVIYGHRMRDGSMFAPLKEYTSQEYYELHPMFWLVTPEKSWYLEVFSVYVADTSAEAWKLDFAGEEEYDSWVQGLLARSVIQSGIIPDPGSRVVTLSTCSYEFEDARLVVHCVLRENQ